MATVDIQLGSDYISHKNVKTNITFTIIFSFILFSCDNRTGNRNETRPKMNSFREIQSSSEYVCAVLKQRHEGFARSFFLYHSLT